MGTSAGNDGVGQRVELIFVKDDIRNMVLPREHMDSVKDVNTKRHKLIIAVLSVVVLILLLIVIILSVSSGNSSNYAQEICVTSACLSAASSIVRSVNTSSNPCKDFWSFSCGGWITSHPLPENKGSYSARDELERRINHDIRHYIDLIRVDDESYTPEWKVRKFYQTCMDHSTNDVNVFDYKITVDFAGWDAKGTLSRPKWSFQESLRKLFAVYGVDAFFSISVDTDDESVGSKIIKIEPSGLGLPHRDFYYNPRYNSIEPSGLGLPRRDFYYNPRYNSYTNAYKSLLVDVAVTFGVVSTNALTFSNNIYSFERRIAKIIPTMQQMQSPKKYVKMRVRDLKRVMPIVNWTQLLRTIYKKGNVKEETYVLMTYPEYFKNLTPLLSSVDDGLMNNYLVWRLVYTYLPYLSQDLSALHNQFVLKMNGANSSTSLSPDERWEFCIRTVTKFLGEAVGALYIKNRIESEAAAVTDVNKIIEVLSATLFEKLDSYPWIEDDKYSTTIRQKVKAMSPGSSIGIGYPKFVTDMKSVAAYYNEYIVTKDYLANVVDGFTFMRKAEERRLITSISSLNNSWNVIPTDIKAHYKLAGNQLFVASGLFRYPFYERDFPIPMKFGALGFQIASQMLRVINSQGLVYDPQGELLEGWNLDELRSKNTILSQRGSEQCLKYDINHYQKKQATDFHVDTSLTAAQSFADVLGLQLVYDSYRKYSMKHGENAIIPSLSKSNDELFFISLAQSMCETVRPEYARSKYKSLTTLPAQQRIELMFRQLKQFQSTFKCGENRNMCQLGLN